MDKITQYIKPLFSLIYFLTNLFKKLIFWRKGSHSFKDQESLLPVTVNTNKSTTQFDYSSSSIVNSYNTNINNNWNLINNRNQNNQIKQDQQEEEPNYFEEMGIAPSLTKQKKLYIRNNQIKEPVITPTYQSDRLNFDLQNVYQTTELGILNEDNSSWENDADLNIDENMKLIKQAERERRIAEHKRLQQEKEAKKAKQKTQNFIATKIS